MISFKQGNLLAEDAEAVVNTVNTHGVMGKGIALMFKEAFPDNFKAYEAACKSGEVQIGRMFVFERQRLGGPKWIINFPTKKHWRNPSKLQWIESGLQDLVRVILEKGIKSIALPPLGAGNGGLDWAEVRPIIVSALGDLKIDIVQFEPTAKYQNVAKREGTQKLTPARALVAEAVRRYWVLGIPCTILEVQKLAYFLEDAIVRQDLANPLKLEFTANKYGPYSMKLGHLLNNLDGSYLHCDKRLADAQPWDFIHFDDNQKERVAAYLSSAEAKKYRGVLEETANLIDGFESPEDMELLATVHWLLHRERVAPSLLAIKDGIRSWPGGSAAAERKLKLFSDRVLKVALERLACVPTDSASERSAKA